MVTAFTIPGEQSNVCFDTLMTRELMTFCQDVEIMVPTFRIVQDYTVKWLGNAGVPVSLRKNIRAELPSNGSRRGVVAHSSSWTPARAS